MAPSSCDAMALAVGRDPARHRGATASPFAPMGQPPNRSHPLPHPLLGSVTCHGLHTELLAPGRDPHGAPHCSPGLDGGLLREGTPAACPRAGHPWHPWHWRSPELPAAPPARCSESAGLGQPAMLNKLQAPSLREDPIPGLDSLAGTAGTPAPPLQGPGCGELGPMAPCSPHTGPGATWRSVSSPTGA